MTSISTTGSNITTYSSKTTYKYPNIKVDVLLGAPPSYNLLYGGQNTNASLPPDLTTAIQGNEENVSKVLTRSNSLMSTTQHINEKESKNNTSVNSSLSRQPKEKIKVQPDLVSNLPLLNRVFSENSLL